MPIFKQLGFPDIRLLTVTINEPITLHYIVRHDKYTAEPILLFLLREIDSKIIRPNSFSESKNPHISEQSARTIINSTCKDHLWTTPDELRALKWVQILPIRAPKAALISSLAVIDLLRHFEMDIKACALEATLICLQSETNILHRLFLGLKGAIAAANYKFKIPSFDSTTVNLLKKSSPSYPPPYQPYHFNRPYHNKTNVPAFDIKTAILFGHLLHHPKSIHSGPSWIPLLQPRARLASVEFKEQSLQEKNVRGENSNDNDVPGDISAVNQHRSANDNNMTPGIQDTAPSHQPFLSWRRHVVSIESQISSPLASTPVSICPNAALNGSPFGTAAASKSPFQPKAVVSNPTEEALSLAKGPNTLNPLNSTLMFKVASFHSSKATHLFIGFSTTPHDEREPPNVTRSSKDRHPDSTTLIRDEVNTLNLPVLIQDHLTSDLIPVAPPKQDGSINHIIHICCSQRDGYHHDEGEEILAAKALSALFPFSTATYTPLSSQFFLPAAKPPFNRFQCVDREIQGIFFPYKPVSLSFTTLSFVPRVPSLGCGRFQLFSDYPHHIRHNAQKFEPAMGIQLANSIRLRSQPIAQNVFYKTINRSSGTVAAIMPQNLQSNDPHSEEFDSTSDSQSSQIASRSNSNHQPTPNTNVTAPSPPTKPTPPLAIEHAPSYPSKSKNRQKAKRGRKSKAELELLQLQEEIIPPSLSQFAGNNKLIKYSSLIHVPDGRSSSEREQLDVPSPSGKEDAYSVSKFTEFALSHFGSTAKPANDKICLSCAKYCAPMLKLPFATESGNIKQDDGDDEHELLALLRRDPRYCESIRHKSLITDDSIDKCECLCHSADDFHSEEGGENEKNKQVGLYGKNNTNKSKSSDENNTPNDDPSVPPTCAPPFCRTTPNNLQFLAIPGVVPFSLISSVALSYLHARATPGRSPNVVASPDYGAEVVASSFAWLSSQLQRPITFSSTLIEFPASQSRAFFVNEDPPDFLVLSDTASHRFVHGKIRYRDGNDTETDIPDPIPSLAPLDDSHYLHPDNVTQVGQGLTSDLMLLCVPATGWMQDWIAEDAMLGFYYPKYKMTPEIALYQNRRLAQSTPQFADKTTPPPQTAENERDEYFKLSESLFPYEIREEHLGVWRSFLFHFENLNPVHRFRLFRHSHCIYNIYPHKRRVRSAKGLGGSTDDSPDEIDELNEEQREDESDNDDARDRKKSKGKKILQHSHRKADNISNPVLRPDIGVAYDQTMDDPVSKRPLRFDSDDFYPQHNDKNHNEKTSGNGNKDQAKNNHCNTKRQKQKHNPPQTHSSHSDHGFNAIFVQLEHGKPAECVEHGVHSPPSNLSPHVNPLLPQSSLTSQAPNDIIQNSSPNTHFQPHQNDPKCFPKPQFEPSSLIFNSSPINFFENSYSDWSSENSSRSSPVFNSLSFFDSDLYPRSEHSESNCNTPNNIHNSNNNIDNHTTKTVFDNNRINNRTTSNLSYESSYQTGLRAQFDLFGFELSPLALNLNSKYITTRHDNSPIFNNKQIETKSSFELPYLSNRPTSPNCFNLPTELNNNSPSYRFNPPAQHYRPQTPLQLDSPRSCKTNHIDDDNNNNNNNNNPFNNSPAFGSLWSSLFSSPSSQTATLSSFFDAQPQNKPPHGQ